MKTDDEILRDRSLSELEDAERRLRTHIKKRRRISRPSMPRRIVGLFISVPMAIFGSFLVYRGLTTNHFLGPHIVIGLFLLIGGGAWLYCDWIE